MKLRVVDPPGATNAAPKLFEIEGGTAEVMLAVESVPQVSLLSQLYASITAAPVADKLGLTHKVT